MNLGVVVAACTALASFASSALARDNTFQLINELRVRDCSRHLSGDRIFKRSARLDVAARYVASGATMKDALRRADYRADQVAMVHLTGASNEAALKRLLLKSYCEQLTDPKLYEAGIAVNGGEIAVVFAAPFAPPAPGDAAKVEREVLQLVNEARATARRCGAKRFAAAAPLKLNDVLRAAALMHAKDMAAHGQVEHAGSDGSSPDQRATRAGYKWKAVGENIAGGQLTAQEVVTGWIGSPHHCENIMDPDYAEMAVAYVINTKQKIGIYWAQEFGRPR